MQLFKSDFFEINYHEKGSLLKGSWVNCQTSDQYISGIKEFKKLYDKILPKTTLWNQQGFHHVITPEGQTWVDTFLNVPAMQAGNTKKVGIILSKELLPTISLLEIFENGKAPVIPTFFSDENEAFHTLMKKEQPIAPAASETEWTIEELGNTGKARITIEVDLHELPHYLKEISGMKRRRNFLLENKHKFERLTRREKEILSLMIKGLSSQSIAELLFISYDTIKTHRKNILAKLDCSKVSELTAFGLFL